MIASAPRALHTVYPHVLLETTAPISQEQMRHRHPQSSAVELTVKRPVIDHNGQVVIPAASRAIGTVEVTEKRRFVGRPGQLRLSVSDIVTPYGQFSFNPGSNNVTNNGKNKYVTTGVVAGVLGLILTPLAMPLALLVKGKDAVIPAFTQIHARLEGALPGLKPQSMKPQFVKPEPVKAQSSQVMHQHSP